MRTNLSSVGVLSLRGAFGLLLGCHHEHHDRDNFHSEEVVVYDRDHHFEHRGHFDEHHDWHGGYYDQRREFHDDPRDFHDGR